jgi:hypothetical protein
MTDNRSTAGPAPTSGWFLPVLSLFAAGFVYSVLPQDVFGSHDVAVRAVITGGTAALTSLLLLQVGKRLSLRTSSR